MSMLVHDAEVAFTYAWWLTGDTDSAEAAVQRAVAELNLEADQEPGRAQLLAAIRTNAIEQPTMCPASELAVLHDSHGLDLIEAAHLLALDPNDATTQLANGRLEALSETVREPFAHPERLGGLAVSNPSDVAHARRCDSCATAARLLDQGRDALREIPAPATPPTLQALWSAAAVTETLDVPVPSPAETTESTAVPPLVTDAPIETRAQGEPPPQAEAADLGTEEVFDEEPATLTSPEPEFGAEDAEEPAQSQDGLEPPDESIAAVLDDQTDETPRVLQFVDGALDPLDIPEDEGIESRRRNWLLPAIVILAIVLLVVTVGSALRPGGSSPDRSPANGQVDDGNQQGSSDRPPPEGFTVDQVGMLRRGEFVPAGPGILLTPTDRVRIAVRYAGATNGVLLEAHWSVDGKPLREMRVTLSSLESMHVFTAPVPEQGWPPGLHQVVLTVGRTVLASVDFRVV